MKKIDGNKVLGLQIWLNEDDARLIKTDSRRGEKSACYLDFESLKDFDKFMKRMREFRKIFLKETQPEEEDDF